jgi:hypothetical protein
LRSVGVVEAVKPDDVFLSEFRRKGLFFIHAVKCWTLPKFPGFGRGGKKADRDRVGLPLLRACALSHLEKDLRALNPHRVCASGKVAFPALAEVWKAIPTSATPTQGRVFSRGDCGLPWDLLYTSFPSRAPAGPGAAQSLREVTRQHVGSLFESAGS